MTQDDLDAIATHTANEVVQKLRLGQSLQARYDEVMNIAQEYYERHWQVQPLDTSCRCTTCMKFWEIRDRTPGDPRPDHVLGACRGGNEGDDSSA